MKKSRKPNICRTVRHIWGINPIERAVENRIGKGSYKRSNQKMEDRKIIREYLG
jgi:hypothetical protein